MKKSLIVVVAVALGLLAVMPAAWSQEGTPNLKPAKTWQGPTVWQGEARTFRGGGNTIWSLGMRGEVNRKTEADVSFLAWSTEGRDPIGGSGTSMSAVRASKLNLITVGVKRRISGAGARHTVSLFPALEIATSGPVGTNMQTGGYAQEKRAIPSVGLPICWKRGATRWILEPKVAWFDSSMPDSVGGVTQGFGRVIGIGLGVVTPIDAHDDFIADVLVVVDGDNTLDENTNLPDTELVWSAGIRWTHGGEKPTVIDLFVTNSAGPTTATSLIGAPDNSRGLGVRVEHEF